MTWFLKYDGVNDYSELNSTTTYHQGLTNYRFEVTFILPTTAADTCYFISAVSGFSGYISLQASGEFRVRYSSNNLAWMTVGYPNDGNEHTIVVVRNGNNHEVFLDGVSQGTVSNGSTGSAALDKQARVGANYSEVWISRQRLWNNTAGTGTPLFDHDANQSARGAGTPILEDFGSEGNNFNGVNMPTDGSAWVDVSGGTFQSAWARNANRLIQ